MRVAVGADQRRDADAVAADIADEIAEDGKARDHVEAILRVRGRNDHGNNDADKPDISR
jgi:hypothetical protein